MDESAAIDALVAANGGEQADSGASTPDQSYSPDTQAAQAQQEQVERFTSIDPEALPDELRHIYKSMQGDYTRKTQEVSQLRAYQALAEQGIGADDAVQSIQFINELNTNPDFQKAVYERLSEAFQDAGASPAQAAQAAADALTGDAGVDDFSDVLPPEVQAKLAKIDELEAYVNEQRSSQELQAIEADLTRAELAIRQANPTYTEEDMSVIRQLGFSTAGDLNAAQHAFEGLRQRLVGGYIDQKASVQATAPPNVSATGYGQEPVKFDSLEQAHTAAIARLRAEGGFDV